MKRIAATLALTVLFFATSARAEDPATLYQLGRDAAARGDLDKAVTYLEKAVAQKPGNAVYHHQLANVYGQQAAAGGMFGAMSLAKKAKGEWERAVQLDPNLLPARFAHLEFNVIAPAIMGGSDAEALAQASEIRKRDATEGHRAFARIHSAAKKPELARREYAEMLKEQPASARAHYYYGVYLMLTEKNYRPAAEELEAAIKLDPAYMPSWFQLGHTAVLSASNFTRGEEGLKKYLAYQPKDEEPPIARAWYWLGSIYEKQGKKNEARSAYAASLKINPIQKDVIAAMKRVS
jgi:tetratricopeptide (TPR) repeat protein